MAALGDARREVLKAECCGREPRLNTLAKTPKSAKHVPAKLFKS